MELKSEAWMEAKRDERVYKMFLPANANLGEVFDVLLEMRGYIISRINETAQQDQPKQAPAQAVVEEVKG